MRLALAITSVLFLSLMARADQWTFFYPETVTHFGCAVTLVSVSDTGMSPEHMRYEAKASAQRSGQPDWGMTVGLFPETVKGRHAAQKACSKWFDEASKRVKAAK